MLKISELPLGFTDAENYKRRENKDLFNHVFIKTDALEKICNPGTSFLIGEKGTGKTAYSVYMSNTHHA
ncbi:MAG: funZ protein, partial [Deltaproteobacteria bacterium]|nr:funZ protein [Deltaproteobacteria bacterium]